MKGGDRREFKNFAFTDYDVAHLAYEIERKDLGIQGGFQDQYAASFGGFNFIEFYGERIIVNPLRIGREIINELEHNLLLCYTGSTRRSDRIIEDQKRRYGNEDQPVHALRQQKQLAVDNEECTFAAPAARLWRSAAQRVGVQEKAFAENQLRPH
jgi:galactokinase/mevalonate kinase-like predicted kinase